mmetsp:Transcript_69339/g.144803  ORF Transcript_69339/g.144803 Transcript_69339/m.144803 type:complete len:312 (-) Transcript_69339:155-1090(-)|eukprot:CAMPEP_0206444010 /NCGR_PEP_ID=MMETSP0324_2-20121206/14683_1 /ASSEMBLY_ACC=CAM_ASM_000836 /TAXON_ID=2866 /ORGANISM="Crypthecodinium cohnii, Strain Seligo" /LENGTH=311 /DNA_ID=CAMNT_0053912003 /DNA_START=199 /DNA_END=1134 /DNA_ORIENTATION=-
MADPVQSSLNEVQHVVHGTACTLVVPGILLVVSALLLGYRTFTEGDTDLPLNGFLANILLQMLPLIAFKLKIWSAQDRVSLVPLVLCKTLLMHVILAIYRIFSTLVVGLGEEKLVFCVDCAGLFGALAILKWEFGFPMSPLRWIEHYDVRNLVLLASLGAFASHAFFVILQPSWMSSVTRATSQEIHIPSVLFTAANYVDIVAFMPVVWRLYQAEEAEDSRTGLTVTGSMKRQIQVFFGFVIAFYMWDDVLDPVMTLLDEPLAMMAHAAHFVLLLDFAGFFLFQVNQPTTVKEYSEQLQGLLAKDDEEDNC